MLSEIQCRNKLLKLRIYFFICKNTYIHFSSSCFCGTLPYWNSCVYVINDENICSVILHILYFSENQLEKCNH